MKRSKTRIARYRILFVVLVVLIAVAVLVMARFMKQSVDVQNTFTPAESIQPTVKETFENNVKSDVYFNVGETGYPVYVRAAIVITWKDEDGIVYYTKPDATKDYILTWNNGDWFFDETDGYYYYKKSVESGGDTAILINKCRQLDSANVPDGCHLSVEIIVQTVQAIGTTDQDNIDAVKDAWGSSIPIPTSTTAQGTEATIE